MKIKARRAIFLIAFFLAVLFGVLCLTGCPSTQRQSSPASILKPALRMPTYKVYVKGLVCPACAVGLKKFLLRLSFVETIHIDYKTGLTLIYEKQQRDKGGEALDKLRISKAIENSGYNVDRFVK